MAAVHQYDRMMSATYRMGEKNRRCKLQRPSKKISEALKLRCTKLGDRRAVALQGLHLQDWRQPGRTGPRSGDFSVCPVTQPDAVKTVTIMNNAFDCLKVHDGMPSDLDERIAA
jgi:hypothetical protein